MNEWRKEGKRDGKKETRKEESKEERAYPILEWQIKFGHGD